jgi:hypothetical protein
MFWGAMLFSVLASFNTALELVSGLKVETHLKNSMMGVHLRS